MSSDLIFDLKKKKKSELIQMLEDWQQLRNHYTSHLEMISQAKKYFNITVLSGLDENFCETKELIYVEKTKYQIIKMFIKELFKWG